MPSPPCNAELDDPSSIAWSLSISFLNKTKHTMMSESFTYNLGFFLMHQKQQVLNFLIEDLKQLSLPIVIQLDYKT